MARISFYCFVSTFFLIINAHAQSIEINGTVIVDDDEIEGIHIINKTANRFTITNSLGNFSIPAKLNDTIIFSAIKYKPKEIIITSDIIISKTLNVYMTELVNELDQVIVGKVLTGNLLSDISTVAFKCFLVANLTVNIVLTEGFIIFRFKLAYDFLDKCQNFNFHNYLYISI